MGRGPSKSDILGWMTESDFFKALPEEKIGLLWHYCEKFELLEGQVLFYQGDPPDYLYILLTGKLVSLLTKPNGNILIISYINPIETVGEIGAFMLEPRSLTIRACVDSELLRIPSQIFRTISEDYPSVLTKIVEIIMQRSIKMIQLIAHERFIINVSVIFFASKNNTHQSLKDKFQLFIQDHHQVYVIDNQKKTPTEIQKILTKAESERINIIILMNELTDELYKMIKDKITYFYIVVSAEDKTFTDESNKVLNQIKDLPKIRLELILVHPEKTKAIVQTWKWLEKADFILHHHMRLNNENDFQRIIRFITGKAFTLVLGGGGAKGLSHLGVIKALFEKKIPIDAIGGTSIGAAIAACYACTMNYKNTLSYVNKLTQSALRSLKFGKVTLPLVSLFSGNPATNQLNHLIQSVNIEDLLIPLFVVSSDLSNKRVMTHRKGLLWEAVRSSASLPGIFPPMVLNGQLFFDGGLLNNLPVDIMRDIIGEDHIIIASSLSRKQNINTYYHFPPVLTFWQSILIKLGFGYKQYRYPPFFETFLECLLLGSSLHEETNCIAADILVRPDLYLFKTLSLKPKDKELLIEIGQNETLAAVNRFFELKK